MTISIICMGIWFLSTFAFQTMIPLFYSNLFGAIGFLMAGFYGLKVFVEDRKKGKPSEMFKGWEKKSKILFLLAMGISIILTFILFVIFS